MFEIRLWEVIVNPQMNSETKIQNPTTIIKGLSDAFQHLHQNLNKTNADADADADADAGVTTLAPPLFERRAKNEILRIIPDCPVTK